MIVAFDERGCIGRDNQLPWRLPADLRHFKTLTTGKTVVMGRKTFESIGRPLPNRHNCVITRDPSWSAAGVDVWRDWANDLAVARRDNKEIMVIGGAEIYRLLLPLVDQLYVTRVAARVKDGDAFFPVVEWSQWQLVQSETLAPDAENGLVMTFEVWVNKLS